MFFIVIIAAILWLYRRFRRTGPDVACSWARVSPLPRGGSLVARLSSSPSPLLRVVDQPELSGPLLASGALRLARLLRGASALRVAPVSSPLAPERAALFALASHLAGVPWDDALPSARELPAHSPLPLEQEKDNEEEEEEAVVFEPVLEGLSARLGDTVRVPLAIAPDMRAAAARVLLWALGCGLPVAAGSLGAGQPTLALLSTAEVAQAAEELRRRLGASWTGRWTMSNAVAAGEEIESGKKGWRLASVYLQMKLVVSDTLFAPAALTSVFGPEGKPARLQHVLVSKETMRAAERKDLALLKGLFVEIHAI